MLKEIKVDKGEKAENWTPEKEGWTFLGWYATPSLKRPFPFDDPVNAGHFVVFQLEIGCVSGRYARMADRGAVLV